MPTEIKVLKAYQGDCILIKSFDLDQRPYNILIDGGTSRTFKYSLRKELKKINVIHLFILTHIDSDHIGGFIRFLKNSLFDQINIEKYWINCPNLLRISSGEKISFNQGKTLEEFLLIKNEPIEKWKDQVYFGREPKLALGVDVKILSPTKEILDSLYLNWPEISNEIIKEYNKVKISSDTKSQVEKGELIELAKAPFKPSKSIEKDLTNSSSISFLLRLFDCSILLLGDSRAEIIDQSLRRLGYNEDHPLNVDYVKVSHHGSMNNTSCELLNKIECNHYIISTNGGSIQHRLPDREVIARILFHEKRDLSKKRTIYFNYPLKSIEQKSGQFIVPSDMHNGNWCYIDDTTSFVPIKNQINK